MNEISTENMSAVIMFHDESEKFITEEQYQGILRAYANPATKTYEIDKNIYYIGGIKKVLSLEEYYKEYPDKIPNYGQPFKSEEYFNAPQTYPKEALPSLIRGLKRAIEEMRSKGHEPKKALALLTEWEAKNN